MVPSLNVSSLVLVLATFSFDRTLLHLLIARMKPDRLATRPNTAASPLDYVSCARRTLGMALFFVLLLIDLCTDVGMHAAQPASQSHAIKAATSRNIP